MNSNIDFEKLLIQNGKILVNQNLGSDDYRFLHDFEFKVFSQWGDDGIIQFLINKLDIRNKTFIEFGVADYNESNTRFLMMNDNWSGLVLDGSLSNVAKIKNSYYYWRFDLIAKHAFVTKENINNLIREEGFGGEIGLLHIDIDGNDYWLWQSIEVVKPIIVIMEYNSIFGYERPITIPYSYDFDRTKAHSSNLYAGSSILSLCDLATQKGYSFIGSNSAGNNAYFVLNDYLKFFKPLTAKEGYVESKFRESRDEQGNLTFLRGQDRLKLIEGMPVYNTRTNQLENI